MVTGLSSGTWKVTPNLSGLFGDFRQSPLATELQWQPQMVGYRFWGSGLAFVPPAFSSRQRQEARPAPRMRPLSTGAEHPEARTSSIRPPTFICASLASMGGENSITATGDYWVADDTQGSWLQLWPCRCTVSGEATGRCTTVPGTSGRNCRMYRRSGPRRSRLVRMTDGARRPPLNLFRGRGRPR